MKFIISLASAFTIILFPLRLTLNAQDRISIGLLIPATGIAGEYGQAILNALQLAKEDFPDLDKLIKFVLEDSRYDGATTTKAFLKLVDVDRVELVYVWGSTPAETAAPLAFRRKIPTILASGDWKLCAQAEHLLCSMPPFESFGSALTSYLRQHGRKKIGILASDLVFFHKVIEGMKRSLSEEKVEVIDFVAPTDQDFRPILSKLRTKSYDALGVFLTPGQVKNFYLQSQQLGVKFPTFGTDVFESMTEIRAANGGMNGAFFASLPLSEEFSKRYQNKFGNDLQISFAGNAYDFFASVARAVRTSASDGSFLDRFRNQFPLDGTTGKLTLEKHGISSPVAIKEISENSIRTVRSF